MRTRPCGNAAAHPLRGRDGANVTARADSNRRRAAPLLRLAALHAAPRARRTQVISKGRPENVPAMHELFARTGVLPTWCAAGPGPRSPSCPNGARKCAKATRPNEALRYVGVGEVEEYQRAGAIAVEGGRLCEVR